MKKSVLILLAVFFFIGLFLQSGCETAEEIEEVFDINGDWEGELISSNTIMIIVSPSVPLRVNFSGDSNSGTVIGYIGTSTVLGGTYTINENQIVFSLDFGGGFVVNFTGLIVNNNTLSGEWTITVATYTGIWTLGR